MFYKIVRFYAGRSTPSRVIRTVIRTGLTLKEAREHCSRAETSSRTATTREAQKHTALYGPWFDGYTKEN